MFRRFYHVSKTLFSYKKEGIKLNKMLNPKVKRKWHENYHNILLNTKSLSKNSHEPGKRSVRRIAVLNKLFMKNITDLLSTGIFAMDIVGRGIEISKVNITSDYQRLNVYWVCKGTINDLKTESILNGVAGPLRHELSSLRLMGEIPYIVFIKDSQEAYIYELDSRLKIADYGEEYVPTEIGHLLKSEFTLDTKLSPEMKMKIKQLEDELPIYEDPIPEMTNTVFGLDHSKIMNRLLVARKRSQDAWNHMDEDSNVVSYRSLRDSDQSPSVDNKKQKEELAEFLLKRQILQNKIHKDLRRDNSEKELVLKEFSQDDVDDYYITDDEYIDDDDFEDIFISPKHEMIDKNSNENFIEEQK